MDSILQRIEPYFPLDCAVRSIQKGRLPPQQCLLSLLSKVLGYAIIAGATILKLPQILLILQKQSTEGLAPASFEIETVGFTIALSYCRFKGLAFSAYGEIVFLLIQDIILVALCYYYSPRRGPSVWLKTALYAAIAPTLISGQLSAQAFETLYACQHAVFIAARLPQLYKNYKQKSTGQLSFSSSFMQFAGICARLFTSIQEKAPSSSILKPTRFSVPPTLRFSSYAPQSVVPPLCFFTSSKDSPLLRVHDPTPVVVESGTTRGCRLCRRQICRSFPTIVVSGSFMSPVPRSNLPVRESRRGVRPSES